MQILRDHRYQPRLLYPAKLSTTIDKERKKCVKIKFNQYLTTNSPLQKVLKGNLQSDNIKHTKKTKGINKPRCANKSGEPTPEQQNINNVQGREGSPKEEEIDEMVIKRHGVETGMEGREYGRNR